ncbi:MAG: transglutaminase domain-containing protein [Anaerolineae bacterium]|nr:transglutaminase domain-containing protein [Anaerolineae bacterium]
MKRYYWIILVAAGALLGYQQLRPSNTENAFQAFGLPPSLEAWEGVNSGSAGAQILEGGEMITVKDTVTYKVIEELTIINKGEGIPSKQNIWLALVRSIPPYQEVHARSISPEGYQVVVDEYDNQYAEYAFDEMPAGSSIEIRIEYEVSVNQLDYDLSQCEGKLPEVFIYPDLHIESSNPQIQSLAEGLRAGKSNVCAQVRAFYDYVGDNLVYTYNGGNWGAQAALGAMGADCTEYSSLLVALCRASGIPARYIEGLYYRGPDPEDDERMEHSWVEVFFPGIGWTPMDPTFGRKVNSRELYFAGMTPDHIIVTQGRNPSTLRGNSYFAHLYWANGKTDIDIENYHWVLKPIK